jgi:hypothetical protein
MCDLSDLAYDRMLDDAAEDYWADEDALGRDRFEDYVCLMSFMLSIWMIGILIVMRLVMIRFRLLVKGLGGVCNGC